MPQSDSLPLTKLHREMHTHQKASPAWRKSVQWALGFVLGTIYLCSKFDVWHNIPAIVPDSSIAMFHSVADTGTVSSGSNDVLEAFELAEELPDFGEPAYSQVLLKHVFADSWGKPAVVEYKAPKTAFNKVILTINTSVSGVQYDRLAHLFLNGVPIWRTSTAEPGNRQVVFTPSKDVSEYSRLFAADGEITYQLDNLINSKLNGVYDVTISAQYYQVETKCELESEHEHEIRSFIEDDGLAAQFDTDSKEALKKIFSVMKEPASAIVPISGKDSNHVSPVRYFPNDDIVYKVDPLPKSVVAANLRLFVSGNAAEEYWYTNVIDPLSHKFRDRGHELMGHGPIRVVKILLDDTVVGIESAEQYIFTGGHSPAFWRPVVSTKAFDLGHIDINLTPYLPLLWHSSSTLRVEIVSGGQKALVSSSAKSVPESVVGQNWIVTGSFMTWDNPEVETTTGFIVEQPERKISEVIITSGRSSLNSLSQVVTHKQSLWVSTIFETKVSNLTKVSYTLTKRYEVRLSNVLALKSFGDDAKVTSASKSTSSLSFSPVVDDAKLVLQAEVLDLHQLKHCPELGLLYAYENSKSFAKTRESAVVIERQSSTTPNDGIKFNYSLATAYSDAYVLDDSLVKLVDRRQNGSSVYFVSANGNHGDAKLESRLKVKLPSEEKNRKVIAEHGEVVLDKECVGVDCDRSLTC